MSNAPTSRWSTRQLLAPTLIFLAALFATVAVASPLILAPQLARVSLDTNLVSVAASTAPVATLDRCSLDRPQASMLEPRTLTRSQRVTVVRPADRTVATLQAGTVIRRGDTPGPGCADPVLLANVDRVTLERTTASPTGASSIQTDSTRPAVVLPERDGHTYLFAPQESWATAHHFFDPITRRTVPLVVVGADTVDGLDVTRLRADIPDTNLAALPGADPRTSLTKPGAWFGWPDASVTAATVTAQSHQRGRYTLWVDAKSGLIVDAEIAVTREYRAGGRTLTDFDATLRYDAKTRTTLVHAARSQARPAWVVGRVIPLVAALGALATVVAGTLRRR